MEKLTSDMTLLKRLMQFVVHQIQMLNLLWFVKIHGADYYMKITREKINVPSVELEYKDNIAVLSISQFGDNTYSEFEEQLANFC